MKKQILKGAGMLAVCAALAKVIGALYRIPLTNVLGTEGIGLYQMVFPLYTVLLTVSSGGLPVAISKTVAARGEKDADKVLRCSLISLLFAGSVAMIAIALLRGVISRAQGNSAASLAYLGIAPSLVFVAVISCFRGYFQGRRNMLPTALSQLTEQLVKLFLGLWLARLMMPYGVEYGVLGSVLGVSLSELAAMLALGGHYLLVKKRVPGKKDLKPDGSSELGDGTAVPSGAMPHAAAAGVNAFEISADPAPVGIGLSAAEAVAVSGNARARSRRRKSGGSGTGKSERKKIMREIYRVAIPVTLGSLVLPLTQVFDSLLVVNILTRVGETLSEATALYGLVTGPVNSLINMPSVVTLALSGALLPQISLLFSRVAVAGSADGAVRAATGKAVRTAVRWGLVFTVGLGAAAGLGMRLLYSAGLTGEELRLGSALLRLGSLSVFYVSVLQVATAVLQGCDRAHVPAVNLLIGASVKLALTVALLPLFGIAGAVAATVACYAVTCVLDVAAMRRMLRAGTGERRV